MVFCERSRVTIKNNLWLRKPEIIARLTALLEKYQREGRGVARRRK